MPQRAEVTCAHGLGSDDSGDCGSGTAEEEEEDDDDAATTGAGGLDMGTSFDATGAGAGLDIAAATAAEESKRRGGDCRVRGTSCSDKRRAEVATVRAR